MSLDLGTLFLLGVGYLSLLFLIAYASDKGLVAESVVSHPLTYALSLGVTAGGWSFFGISGVAANYGYGYIGYFMGIGALFLFAPLVLLPLLRICRRHQLTSLADLLSFRYRGSVVGAACTIGMLAAALPLVAAEIKIVSDLAAILSGTEQQAHGHLGLIFALAIAVFAILFGARPISDRERHNGLVVAMAFESLVKLAAFLFVGVFAVTQVFGGMDGLSRWLGDQPQLLEPLAASARSSSSHMLTITFLAAAIGLPHLFHIALYENPRIRAVFRATWGFPLLLLLLCLPILPVLWAGLRLDLDLPVEYFAAGLGLSMGSPAVALLVFIGGLSAASSTIVVMTLALASMTMNNLILPFYRLGTEADLYRGLIVIRSVLTAFIILAAQIFSMALPLGGSLEKLGFTGYIAAAQFFPGILALLYWPTANRAGFLGGLTAGFGVWLLMILAPAEGSLLGSIAQWLPITIEGNHWATTALNSIGLNALVLIALSLLSKQRTEERETAAACSLDNLSGRARHQMQFRSTGEFVNSLARTLGKDSAQREVERALRDLGYQSTEARPYAMRRLRDRIEANLSRLMGASVAMELVKKSLPYVPEADPDATEDIYSLESRLEGYQRHLTGFTAQLDGIRRFYRDTLQGLPIGVCGMNNSNEIVMWNHALEGITGIESSAVLGLTLAELKQPWGQMIADFADSDSAHLYNRHIHTGTKERSIYLHKSVSETANGPGPDARFVLLEDVTDMQLLQDELVHSERLASIGRLAAGVAHEIGNPLTGIDCLAQNLLVEGDEATTRESAKQILNQTLRISNIVQTLVNFAHAGVSSHGALEPLDVYQCAEEAIYLLGLDRNARQVNFRNLCSHEITAVADGQRLLQVLLNLLSNARDAVENGGEITVENRRKLNRTLITVTDNGCGIPRTLLDQVLEPFFTTKAPGEGTGLGLALVYSIVRDMDGSMEIESPLEISTGRGVRVSISLPSP